MSRRWPAVRRQEEEEPGSELTARLLILGYLVAAGVGVLAGLIWIGWNLLHRG